jgi:NADPH:quinone reductase-like Zn-dependent oxidoreductase
LHDIVYLNKGDYAMDTMKAVLCEKYGGPEVLKLGQIRKPATGADELLLKIYSSSVTRSDLFVRGHKIPLLRSLFLRLAMGIRKPRNPVLGQTFAGIVELTGPEITRFRKGDRVVGLGGFTFGGYADYKCMKETDSMQGCLAKIPESISFEDATSAAYGGLLALQFMESSNIKKGDRVLVYGASGTSGIMAVQFAKHLGANVTGVCGPANLDFVISLGADKVLDYTDPGAVSGLEWYDFILDAVGKAKTSLLKKAARKVLAPGGRFASIDDKALILDSKRLERILDLVKTETVKPVTDRVFPLEQIVEAHEYVERDHKRGNVAVTVN